jgi:hypothetical protein
MSYNNEHTGLGLRTCSFKAQGVLGLFVFVFQYPAIPEFGTEKPASVGSFYPFDPGGLTISFDSFISSTVLFTFNVTDVRVSLAV